MIGDFIKSKKLMRVALATLFLVLSPYSYSSIKVAIIDTGFCLNSVTYKGVTINPSIDATDGLKEHCISPSKGRLHGRKVLDEFLNNLAPKYKKKVEITPIITYDKNGQQTIDYWKKALNAVTKIKANYLILSVALPLINTNNPKLKLPSLTFVAAGRAERRITSKTVLWPHHWKSDNMLLIGGYFGNSFDKKTLYQKKIDYYFPFSSSLANAIAAAKAINFCHSKDFNKVKFCLEKRAKIVTFNNADIVGKTVGF